MAAMAILQIGLYDAGYHPYWQWDSHGKLPGHSMGTCSVPPLGYKQLQMVEIVAPIYGDLGKR